MESDREIERDRKIERERERERGFGKSPVVQCIQELELHCSTLMLPEGCVRNLEDPGIFLSLAA